MTAAGDSRTQASRSDELAASGGRSRPHQSMASRMLELSGGMDAPNRARRWVLSSLSREVGISREDIALIVSELVTNSVVHARVDESQLLRVTIASVKGRWRITVTDPGSDTDKPCLRAADPRIPGGLGLRLVDVLCADWGTVRDARGAMHVWCDLPARRSAIRFQDGS